MSGGPEVLPRLREAIERVGITNLLERPGLARNVFSDLFPDEPLTVSLLSAAVESGVVSRLEGQTSAEDARIVLPRLAEGLAGSRGIVPRNATWAVEMWAAALGLRQEPPAPLTAEEPGASQPAPVPVPVPVPVAGGKARRSLRPRRSVPAAGPEPHAPAEPAPTPRWSDDSTPQETRLRPQPAEPEAPSPWWSWIRSRRIIPLAAVAVVLVGVAVVAFVVVVVPGDRPSSAASWSMTAEVVPLAGSAATVSHGMATKPLQKATVPLHSGDRVTVDKGPAEIRFGDSVVRLDTGSAITYLAATKSAPPLLNFETGEAMYANVAKGKQVAVRLYNGDHFFLQNGRLIATCPSSCTYQALDEPQTVHTSDRQMVQLAARQKIRVSNTGEPMAMQMGEPAPAATEEATAAGGMAGMGAASPAGAAAPASTFTAHDVLAGMPWVTANMKLDGDEQLSFRSLGGRSLLGSWTLMLQRPDFHADVHRVVTFSRTHCDAAGAVCVLSAAADFLDPSGKYVRVRAVVSVGDSGGRDVTLRYDPVAAACGSFGHPDGMQQVVDNLRFSGSGKTLTATGTRTTIYTPSPGSTCRSKSETAVQPAVIVEASRGNTTVKPTLFTRPGATEQLVVQHVLTGTCDAAQHQRATSTADVVCKPTPSASAGPDSIELVSFATDAALRAEYAQRYKASHRTSTNSGSCEQGACERPFGGDGRTLSYGGDTLVQYDLSKSRVLIIAGGTSGTALGRWFPDQHDFSYSARPVRGL